VNYNERYEATVLEKVDEPMLQEGLFDSIQPLLGEEE
jgi:hypothetical protein